MRPELGIIGYGRCGQLAAEVLEKDFHVMATDVRDLAGQAAARGVAWGDLADCASRPTVLLAVPVRTMPEVLQAMVPHLKPGAIVVDMASVKVEPMRWMEDLLPVGVSWVGTHPLFGPESAPERSVRDQRIVVCEAEGHAAAARSIEVIARRLGLETIRLDPETHDREMARSQALVFLLARALAAAGLGGSQYGTPSERRVWSALNMTAADTDELYEDILKLNPFAPESTRALVEAVEAEAARLTNG
ncbi:MAG TPA: prephenate dehydrogenase/arogenate dehydrogenase family protein [Gemmatimonadota bacterium]|nr:prephenate dehydrogenase/arogenate dehydrogenase family protein [Gemmatimonadota bacterium]